MPTTAPSDPNLFDRLTAIPPVGWLVIAALIAGLVRWIQLRIAIGNNDDEAHARNRMTDCYITLRRTGELTKNEIDDVRNAASQAGMTLRDFDPAEVDPRHLILHDDAPRRPIAAFPRLAYGRLVQFWSGRIVLVTESAFEKLLEADDALRDKLRDGRHEASQDEKS